MRPALLDAKAPYQIRCGFASALKGNKAPKGRIRNAVLSVFNVTGKPILESWISGDRDDQVVPPMELTQQQRICDRLVGLKSLRG